MPNHLYSDSAPKCSSNISVTGVLIENDCGLEPDYIELNCNVGYHGNVRPTLEWRHSVTELNEEISISDISEEQPTLNGFATVQRMIVKPNFQLNGTTFHCSLATFETNERRFGCSTKSMNIICKHRKLYHATLIVIYY